jgi:peptide/nickel transport system permease protein
MCGVIIVVFFLFQGFGDPTRLVMGQTADAATQQNIRKELNLDKPRWKQFLTYINDVSPVAVHTKDEIKQKKLKGIFIGSGNKTGY